MFSRPGQRVVFLDVPLPNSPANAGCDERDELLSQLDTALAVDTEYLPLEIYLRRRRVQLVDDTSLEAELARCVRETFARRYVTKKMQHSRLGRLLVFPVAVLDALYSPAPASDSAGK